ncbi:hypothetical protein [Thermosulfuriphilus sp.]
MAEVKIPGAVVQKDGSFAISVELPQLALKAEVLSLLADLAREGYLVHPTTAQKIMILGIPKDRVAGVIEALETAGAQVRKSGTSFQPRTCVGLPFCKLALKETFPLAEKIYYTFKGRPVPHKFKVAISGCPACCSWANNIDLGFVAVRDGFKIYIGGKGGYRPRPGVLLGKASGEKEALGAMEAVLEFFNRYGRPRKRLAWAVEKTGLDPLMKELQGLIKES